MKTIITILLLSISGVYKRPDKGSGNRAETNNGPLESASIFLFKGTDTINSKTTVTNKEGKFIFSDVSTGIYHIRISAVGY
ncbi:MAG: carboxypeptidase-like regulatory domain-containing protein [Puia sp.]